MLNLYTKEQTGAPPVGTGQLSDEEVIAEIYRLKAKLADQVVFLGHHYQQDDIIAFADYTGDSLALAREAAKLGHKDYIIFCGVHFMAETAAMLGGKHQKVILPDPKAGCSMADMANDKEVNRAYQDLLDFGVEGIVPITYINCTAALKSFVGKHGGTICTSSNARKVIQWAFNQGERLFFFPDQHLGRNTCVELGIPLEDMVIYDPRKPQGGLTKEQALKAKVFLWYGFCSVHQGFNAKQVENLRATEPNTLIAVHPECPYEVVSKSDFAGSTAALIEYIKAAPSGASIAVGTEINLVNRMAQKYPDKRIFSLSPYQCLCATMYRIRPRWLLESLRSIERKEPTNVITVDAETTKYALVALQRMMEIS